MTTRATNLTNDIHQPLTVTREEIRLVTLAPGNFNEPIHCDLYVVSLQHKPYYEALSYVWGDANDVVIIQLCGQPFKVTDNLESALRHLRHATLPRVLWIDAICINQTDNAERTEQVGQMRSVYSSASQVVVWLGEGGDESSRALELVVGAADDSEKHWVSSRQPSIDKTILNQSHMDALMCLLERPWWDRTWTVQECVLARKLTFVVGNESIAAEKLWSFEQNYRKHVNSCGCIDYRFNERFFTAMRQVSNLNDYRDPKIRNSIKFSKILRVFHRRKCFDPRDHVYGYLAMASGELENVVLADYTQTPERVYEDFILKCFEQSHELRELSYLYRNSQVSALSLPSWVPDWTITRDEAEEPWLQVRELCIPLYNAGTRRTLSLRRPGFGTLILEGVSVDKIRTVGTVPSMKNGDLKASTYVDWYKIAAAALPSSSTYGFMPAKILFHRIICNTRLEQNQPDGRLEPRRIGGNDFLPVFEKWFEAVRFETDNPDSPAPHPAWDDRQVMLYHTTVISATLRRRFFVSETGYMGLTPQEAEAGDVVVVFAGSHLPHVLRPPGKVDGGGALCHQILGDAYAQGIMDGEMFDAHRPNQTFVIM